MLKQILGPTFVTGIPAPFATAREVEWKETVAKGIQDAWGDRGYIEHPCEVLLEFHLPPARAAVTDLDNLLKPAIDAVGAIVFKPARMGHQVRWNADDHWIYRFVANKFAAPREDLVGLRVTINELMGAPDVQTS